MMQIAAAVKRHDLQIPSISGAAVAFAWKFWWLKIMATVEELAHQITREQMGEITHSQGALTQTLTVWGSTMNTDCPCRLRPRFTAAYTVMLPLVHLKSRDELFTSFHIWVFFYVHHITCLNVDTDPWVAETISTETGIRHHSNASPPLYYFLFFHPKNFNVTKVYSF